MGLSHSFENKRIANRIEFDLLLHTFILRGTSEGRSGKYNR